MAVIPRLRRDGNSSGTVDQNPGWLTSPAIRSQQGRYQSAAVANPKKSSRSTIPSGSFQVRFKFTLKFKSRFKSGPALFQSKVSSNPKSLQSKSPPVQIPCSGSRLQWKSLAVFCQPRAWSFKTRPFRQSVRQVPGGSSWRVLAVFQAFPDGRGRPPKGPS